MRSRLGPFRDAPFSVYCGGGLISNIGTWLQNVVGAVFVYDRTGSALAVGILSFATFAPILLFSFPVLTGTIQTEVPDSSRGRLLAINQMSHLGNRPFAGLAAGALAAAFTVPVAALVATLLAPIGLLAVRAAWRDLDRRVETVTATGAAT